LTHPYGGQVDDAIMQDLFPSGQEPSPLFGMNTGAEAIKSTVAALEIIEKHLEPITTDQLAALALLNLEGGQFKDIADFFLTHHKLRGHGGPLAEALASASLIKSFRGVSGSLLGGKVPGYGPQAGGMRR
jgi:hypothetical protein